MKMRNLLIISALISINCASPMDAKEACQKLASQVTDGSVCVEDQPGGIGAAAIEKYEFTLDKPAGEKCQVLSFRSEEDLDSTVVGFNAVAFLAGPHRYANKNRRIFVQCNEGMPRPTGVVLEKAVEQL